MRKIALALLIPSLFFIVSCGKKSEEVKDNSKITANWIQFIKADNGTKFFEATTDACKAANSVNSMYKEEIAKKFNVAMGQVKFYKLVQKDSRPACEILFDTPIGPISCAVGSISARDDQPGQFAATPMMKLDNGEIFNVATACDKPLH